MTFDRQAHAVGLDEVLESKEARMKRQHEWLSRHSSPLISFTVNIPGPYKLTPSSHKVFEQGVEAISLACKQHGCDIAARQLLTKNTGPEGVFAVKAVSASVLKKLMIKIESCHPLGRLMDLDVIGVDGKIISRQGKQMPRRKCLICEQDAVVCGRSHRHTLSELTSVIDQMVREHEFSA
ncbi:citrate lyase holo-[acyl-carrier protein] synthase [uncultured Vibrio sp.]|uniref:citrate lyase holo-[acyl-carrier protein] synthase n=1 Tax=uncultured Vibrio sp. TaxID=114054 RepID=UPI0029C724C7|nr:citrate lyase holo-[acyl-carrier protein] synthase [uncultured Vibrio sp.]